MNSTFSVYVAEDEPLARQALLAMFDAYPSWRVVGNADNGERAFEECLASRPDLLLTDIRMPRLNGIELVAGLRPLLPGMRVAFITAHDQHAIAAFRLAAIDYLLKPVSDAEFLACLRRVEQDVIRQRRADAKDRAAPPVDALIRQQRERIEHLVIRSVGRIGVQPRYVQKPITKSEKRLGIRHLPDKICPAAVR